jgi:predicted  nucleic acid-binding Zn-ribbon protein
METGTMLETLTRLLDLSEVDRQIIETRRQLELYPGMLKKMESEEEELKRVLAESESRLEEARGERRQAEKDVKGLREKVTKYLHQQMATRNQKEYDAIEHEVAGLNEKIDRLETVGLEKLDIEEKCQADKKRIGRELEELGRSHEEERRRIEEQTRRKRQSIERLEAERDERLKRLDEHLREEYESLNERYPGSVVVTIDDEHCSGCHWHLVPQTRQQIRLGQELARCDHCRRFIYAQE